MTSMAQIVDAGPDTSLCVNSYTMQGSSVPLGATGYWVFYTGCGYLFDPTQPSTMAIDLCFGVNVLGWTIDSAGISTSDLVAITVYDSTIQTASAGVDIQITIPNTTALLIANPYAYPCSCQWTIVQGSGVIGDVAEPITYAYGLTVGSNLFAWTCDNGACGITSDTMMVEVLDPTGLVPLSYNGPVISYDPVSERIMVSTSEPVMDLRVMDMNGRIISNNAIDQGLYIAAFRIGDQSFWQRIVVAR